MGRHTFYWELFLKFMLMVVIPCPEPAQIGNPVKTLSDLKFYELHPP